jgi:hypothetical protein
MILVLFMKLSRTCHYLIESFFMLISLEIKFGWPRLRWMSLIFTAALSFASLEVAQAAAYPQFEEINQYELWECGQQEPGNFPRVGAQPTGSVVRLNRINLREHADQVVANTAARLSIEDNLRVSLQFDETQETIDLVILQEAHHYVLVRLPEAFEFREDHFQMRANFQVNRQTQTLNLCSDSFFLAPILGGVNTGNGFNDLAVFSEDDVSANTLRPSPAQSSVHSSARPGCRIREASSASSSNFGLGILLILFALCLSQLKRKLES